MDLGWKFPSMLSGLGPLDPGPENLLGFVISLLLKGASGYIRKKISPGVFVMV